MSSSNPIADQRAGPLRSAEPNFGAMPRHRQSGASLLSTEEGFELSATLRTVQKIILSSGIFGEDNDALDCALAGRRAVAIVDKVFFGLQRDSLAAWAERLKGRVLLTEQGFSEEEKSFNAVLETMRTFERSKLGRRDVVIAIGGGVCCDVVSFAAAMYRRGIQHVKIPTTFLGIVDAGIGIKNAVNLNGAKNRIGTFFPPECSILDPSLSCSQRYEDFRCGVAEMLKVAITSSQRLFELMETVTSTDHSTPHVMQELSSTTAVELAVEGLLKDLAADLYEVGDLRRAPDFGHSFSPELEEMFEGRLAHGDAVAVEMLLLAELSHALMWIDREYLDRIYALYSHLRLPALITSMTADVISAGLRKTTLHRAGRLSMPVPFRGPGQCAFIDDTQMLPHDAMEAALRRVRIRTNACLVLNPP